MTEKTNLDRVKEKALMLLYLDISSTKYPFVIHHPYFSTTVIGFSENGKTVTYDLTKQDELDKARKRVKKSIEEIETYSQFLMLITPPYLPVFFKITSAFISVEDFSTFLAALWTHVEFPNVDANVSVNDFVCYFQKAKKSLLMEPNELEEYDNLPETITVYRGIFPDGKVKALSWTLSKEKAEWFANRFNAGGNVYCAEIEKQHVFAYFSGRGEDEIVLNPNKLINIAKC